MVELADRGRMADGYLRGERVGDHPAALLKFHDVAAVAQHWPVRQPLQDALCHRCCLFPVRHDRPTETGGLFWPDWRAEAAAGGALP
jgi:hypothetical protein